MAVLNWRDGDFYIRVLTEFSQYLGLLESRVTSHSAVIKISKCLHLLQLYIIDYVVLSLLKFSKIESKLVSQPDSRVVLGLYSFYMQESETSSYPLE